jgi:hypothetical protein
VLTPFEVYQTYLSISRHFTTNTYDYHKYCGKSRCSLKSFHSNKSRFFFEKISRKYSDEEIVNLFVANYAILETSGNIWVGDIVRSGEENYKNWMRKNQSLSYIFKEEVSILNSKNFDEMFSIQGNKHPKILKEFLQKKLSLETMIILNNILDYKKQFDKKLQDPVWEFVSMRIEKYSPFLHIDGNKFKSILKECVM